MRGKRLAVLAEVEKGPATARDIADALGYTFPCACANLSYLFHEGLLDRQELSRDGRGPRERVYRLKVDTTTRAQGGSGG